MKRPNTLGNYRKAEPFAYAGWRLTMPGQPAGGQYHGFVANEVAVNEFPEHDQFRLDRAHGIASHDPKSASVRHPRGVYRSSAEVPPNPTGPRSTSWAQQIMRTVSTAEVPGAIIHAIEALGDVPSESYYTDPRIAYWTDRTNFVARIDGAGPTSVVNAPPRQQTFPPAPVVYNVPAATPVSPQPAPVVAVATQAAGSALTSAENFLMKDSLGFGLPNWGYGAAAIVVASLLGGKKGRW